jgi:Lactonase, 7-bladed beta-propeller
MWRFRIFKNVALLPSFLRALGFSQTTLNVPDPNMRFNRLPLGSLATSAVATNLWVSSYTGDITSLHLSPLPKGGYSLIEVAINNGSAPQPSWLTKDECNGVIYCLNEAFSGPNGTIASYKASANGVLTQVDIHNTIIGPVSSVVYNGGKALAVAH